MALQSEERLHAHLDAWRIVARIVDAVRSARRRGKFARGQPVQPLAAVPVELAEQGIPYATDEDLGSPDPMIAQWDLGDLAIEAGLDAWASGKRGVVQ